MSDLPPDRDTPLCALDAVLEEATVLVEEYAGYDEYAARRRIARRVVAHRSRPAAAAGPGSACGAGVPGPGPSARGGHLVLDAACHVRAARLLDQTARALVESRSYAVLALDAAAWPHSAESTLLFAGLLHLAGKAEGAQFWFQYAAGAGSRAAARCLYLHHLARAEVATARHWHEQCRELPEDDGLPDLPPVPHDLEQALTGSVIWASPPITTQDLTSLATGPGGSGRTGYRLPPRLRLATTARTWTGDPDLGEVFLPAPQVAIAVAHQARLPRAHPADRAPVHPPPRVLEAVDRHAGGVSPVRIARETRIPYLVLARATEMLVRADPTSPAGPGAFEAGCTVRLPAGSGGGGRGYVGETLAWLRDAVGAAVYVARYADGEVAVTQYADGEVAVTHNADGPAAPAVGEWVDFRAAAHASAVGRALWARLDHHGRSDHLSRHRPVLFAPRTLGGRAALFHQLDARCPDEPLPDLRGYTPVTVRAAVPIAAGPHARCVALSIPVPDPGRPEWADRILRSEAAAVLLALLVAGSAPRTTGAESGAGGARRRGVARGTGAGEGAGGGAGAAEGGQGRDVLSTTA